MRLLIIISMLWLATGLWAQVEHGFDHFNKRTYELYQQGDWKALADTTKQAIDRGFDSYYFRMRLGEAYYNLEKYRKADRQFYEALKFSENDPSALGFYYESALLGGKSMLANYLSDQYSQILFDQPKRSFSPIDQFYLESGIYLTPSDIPADHLYYGHAGINSRITPKLRWYNAYAGFYQNATDTFYVDETTAYSPYQVIQHEYITSVNWLANQNLILSPNFHAQWLQLPETTTFNWIAGASGAYTLPLMDVLAGAQYGELKDTAFTQLSAGLVLYPWQNSSFYLSAIPTYLFHESRWLVDAKVGVQLTENLWLEGSYSYGPLEGSASWDGKYFFNNYDPMNWRAGVAARWFTKRSNSIGLSYYYLQRESIARDRTYPQQTLMLHYLFNSKN